MSQTITIWFSVLLCSGIVISAAYFFVGMVSESIRVWRDRMMSAYSHRFDVSLKEDYEKYFTGRLSYYDRLPAELRIKFLLRVRSFVRSKTFEGRGEMPITEEMKVMIAASAVQLTFGLTKYILDNFSRIIIYPDSYYSSVTGQYHMGEANPRGILVISWNDFLKGYADSGDTYNVGLHEMAHALELNQLLGSDYDFYFATYYTKFRRIAEEEYENVRDGHASFFRSYAGTNHNEFFAVCIETFFEDGEEFRSKLPQLYRHLSILLNQDPLNRDMRLNPIEWNRKAVYADVLASPEIFVTRFSYFDLIFSLVPFFFFLLFFFSNGQLRGAIISGIALTGGVPLLLFSFRLNRIVMFDKYIGIKSISGKLKAAFPLDEIVNVSFHSGRGGDSIQILTVGEGRLLRYAYSYSAKSEDLEELHDMLKEKNVVVK